MRKFGAHRRLGRSCAYAVGLLAACYPVCSFAQTPHPGSEFAWMAATVESPVRSLVAGTDPVLPFAVPQPTDRRMVVRQSVPSCERKGWDDKRRHFILSMAITTGSYLMIRKGFGARRSTSLILSVSTAVALGYGKELWDSEKGSPPCFSKRDLLANAAGILTATGIILVID